MTDAPDGYIRIDTLVAHVPAKKLIEIALSRKDPEAAASLYMLTSYKEPMYVEAWHKQTLSVQFAVDDLFEVMEWLREDKLFAQADRIRTLMARLAKSVGSEATWDYPLVVDIARTFPEQLSIKESKALRAELATAQAALAVAQAQLTSTKEKPHE